MKKDGVKSLPIEVKEEVKRIIEEFNKEELDLINEFYMYFAEFKGLHVFLKTKKYGIISPKARLKYTGNMKNWDFAIYKYSSERYDPDEFFFPGAECVDGTVKGALYACNNAYPPM